MTKQLKREAKEGWKLYSLARSGASVGALAAVLITLPAFAAEQEPIEKTYIINKIEDSKVIEAINVLGEFLGASPALIKFTLYDEESGRTEPALMIDDALAGAAKFPLSLGTHTTMVARFTSTTEIYSGSRPCRLEEVGGDLQWVPRAHCP
jgi:hypothetical protein